MSENLHINRGSQYKIAELGIKIVAEFKHLKYIRKYYKSKQKFLNFSYCYNSINKIDFAIKDDSYSE